MYVRNMSISAGAPIELCMYVCSHECVYIRTCRTNVHMYLHEFIGRHALLWSENESPEGEISHSFLVYVRTYVHRLCCVNACN